MSRVKTTAIQAMEMVLCVTSLDSYIWKAAQLTIVCHRSVGIDPSVAAGAHRTHLRELMMRYP